MVKRHHAKMLYLLFHGHIASLRLIVNEGKMIDPNFIVDPRQRNTRDENKKIKEGQGDYIQNRTPVRS